MSNNRHQYVKSHSLKDEIMDDFGFPDHHFHMFKFSAIRKMNLYKVSHEVLFMNISEEKYLIIFFTVHPTRLRRRQQEIPEFKCKIRRHTKARLRLKNGCYLSYLAPCYSRRGWGPAPLALLGAYRKR